MVQSKVYNQISGFMLSSYENIPSLGCPFFLHCNMIYWAKFFLFMHDVPRPQAKDQKSRFLYKMLITPRFVSEVKGTEEYPKAAAPLDRLWYRVTGWEMTIAIELGY